jgi:hypothetical protein
MYTYYKYSELWWEALKGSLKHAYNSSQGTEHSLILDRF